jgi:hypothetical protein
MVFNPEKSLFSTNKSRKKEASLIFNGFFWPPIINHSYYCGTLIFGGKNPPPKITYFQAYLL